MYKFKLQDQTILYVIVIGIFLFFFALYLFFSLLLARTGSFENYRDIFAMDPLRVIGDMTSFDADHYRTKVHPLFVLLVNPMGMLLSRLLRSQLLATLVLNSFFGATGVFLAFFFFKSMTENIYNAALLACLFGVTTSQFFLSVIPETASLATCSLLTTYLVFLSAAKYKWNNFLPWVFAGIFALAITTTNFIQTLICFTFFSFMRSNLKSRPLFAFGRVFAFLICVVASTALFSKVQKFFYPSSSFFYLAESYQEEVTYASLMIFQTPLLVISQLLKHSFLVNIIAPLPHVYFLENKASAITFNHTLNFTLIGWLGVFLWSASLVVSAFQAFRKKQELPLFVGFTFAVCLLFNFALHSVYGIGSNGEFEYFLYTGNFSFLVLSGLASLPFNSGNIYRVLLGMLVLLAGINNMFILSTIINMT